jgi:DNA-binding NarL/FixJ family response regulator
MSNPADVSVAICTHMSGIARTLRMALRGMGVRYVALANDTAQLVEGFAAAEPSCVIIYVESADPADLGLQALNFIRKSADSPNARIPVVAVSSSRDLPTINAVINGGGHEYVLFPASGDVLLKKITAARTTTRPWIDRADYFGPERRVDREAQPAVESVPESEAGDAAEAGEKTAG